jgi:hypothetical protein
VSKRAFSTRDNGLVGERLEQRDVGGRESSRLRAAHDDHAKGIAATEHRHRDERADAPLGRVAPELGAARRVRLDVDDVVHALREH